MSTRRGVHFEGPILLSNRAGDGLFEDIPAAQADLARGPFRYWHENFNYPWASIAELNKSGAVITDASTAGTAASNGSHLTLYAGTAASTGLNVQLGNGTVDATGLSPIIGFPSTILTSAAAGVGRDIVYFCRFGLSSNGTAWDGSGLVGMFVADTTLTTQATGAPTIASAGGAGFHISQAGAISTIYGSGAITAVNGAQVGSVGTLTGTTTIGKWFECGFRYKDLTTSTGRLQMFFGSAGGTGGPSISKVLDVSQFITPLVFPSFVIANGAAQQSRMFVETVFLAYSRTSVVASNQYPEPNFT